MSFPSYLRVSFLRVVAILKICVRSKYERTGIEFPSETVLVSYFLVVRSRKFPRISETWPIQAPDRWLNENHSKWPPSAEKTQSTTKKIRLILSIFIYFTYVRVSLCSCSFQLVKLITEEVIVHDVWLFLLNVIKLRYFRKSLIALRVVANILVLGVLSASAYLIYLVVKRSDEREKEGRPPTVLEQYEV